MGIDEMETACYLFAQRDIDVDNMLLRALRNHNQKITIRSDSRGHETHKIYHNNSDRLLLLLLLLTYYRFMNSN